MISGIVIRDSAVLKDTIFTESAVSLSNFEANIVVIAATGELIEITDATKIVPLKPHKYITAILISGKPTSLKAIA